MRETAAGGAKDKTRPREGGRVGRGRRPALDARGIDVGTLAAGGADECAGVVLGERGTASDGGEKERRGGAAAVPAEGSGGESPCVSGERKKSAALLQRRGERALRFCSAAAENGKRAVSGSDTGKR
nr:MAG TPA: hypothetical protein [Caudoviricetes sp.]